MAGPKLDLGRKIKDILGHVGPLPAEAGTPFAHYEHTSADIWALREYTARSFRRPRHFPAAANRHLLRLHGMILISLIETFERFLKETAAVCVTVLARYVLDDRFDEFRIQGSNLAAHFGSDTLGKALCESDTWLDCKQINDRFRRLLANPFEAGAFYVFPRSGQQPVAEQWRFETMSLLWQIRHTIVHNVGAITHSDAIKLRLLAREHVAPDRILTPDRDDLRYAKRFLDESASSINQRVVERLAALLTAIHSTNPSLFVPQEHADELARLFGKAVTVAGATGLTPS